MYYKFNAIYMKQLLTKAKKFSKEHRQLLIVLSILLFLIGGWAIQTVGSVQTGEKHPEVANIVKTDKVVGEATSDGEKIKNITLSHSLVSGADPVNMIKSSYAIETQNNATFISGDPNEQDGIRYLQTQSIENYRTVVRNDNTVRVQLNLTKIDGIDPIKSNSKINVSVNSASGAQSHVDFKTPEKITDGEKYTLYD